MVGVCRSLLEMMPEADWQDATPNRSASWRGGIQEALAGQDVGLAEASWRGGQRQTVRERERERER